MDVTKLVRPNVRRLRAYGAREIPARVKLDANESPFGFGKPALKGVRSNRYPDPEAKALRRAFASTAGVPARNVLAGNGSDELIYYLITTFGGPVLYPTPTFSMYEIIGRALGERTVGVPLDREFDIDLARTLAAVRKHRPKLIFLSSPNNPTGNCFSTDRMLALVEAARGLVVVDEAYQPFSSSKGFVSFLKDYDNLLVMRTLSKVGLAALRVGFLIGGEEIVNEVNKVRLPFNVNALSQSAAVEALNNRKALRKYIGAVSAERDRLFGAMDSMEGLTAYPTEANFVMFRVDDPQGVHKKLLGQGVLVRDVSGTIRGCLRVTVGARGENDAFLRALKRAI